MKSESSLDREKSAMSLNRMKSGPVAGANKELFRLRKRVNSSSWSLNAETEMVMSRATFLIGALFVLCGGWVLIEVPTSNLGGVICGVLLLFLGVEALISVMRGRRSLLSRIGPLH